MLTDDQKAEVRAALNQVLAVYKGDDEDPEMPPLTFATARDVALHANDYEMYADHVAWRVSRVRVLLAACEDIGDALGDLEEDEALAAVRATIDHWRSIAEACPPGSAARFRLVMITRLLADRLGKEDIQADYLADLVSIASFQDQLLHDAATLFEAQETGTEDEWWERNGDVVLRRVLVRTNLLRDLKARGEEVHGWDDFTIGPGQFIGPVIEDESD